MISDSRSSGELSSLAVKLQVLHSQGPQRFLVVHLSGVTGLGRVPSPASAEAIDHNITSVPAMLSSVRFRFVFIWSAFDRRIKLACNGNAATFRNSHAESIEISVLGIILWISGTSTSLHQRDLSSHELPLNAFARLSNLKSFSKYKLPL